MDVQCSGGGVGDGAAFAANGDEASIRVSATASSSPPRITLSWPQRNVDSPYSVYRKTRDAASWGNPIASLVSNSTGYTDSAGLQLNQTYEYRVTSKAADGADAYGYVYSGIEAPLVENRGNVLLVIEDTHASALSAELSRLKQDLCGDGWTVIERSCSRNDTVPSVKAKIVSAYNENPDVKMIFLFGRVPVPYSGTGASMDRHEEHFGAMPADTYYADVEANWEARWTDSTVDTYDFRTFESYLGNVVPPEIVTWQNYVDWFFDGHTVGHYNMPLMHYGGYATELHNVPGDGKFDPENLPRNVNLPVGIGRVDLSNMPEFEAVGGERELLRRYLNKNHNFRHKLTVPERRGLVADGEFAGYPYGFTATGYRNSPALFGQPATTVVGFGAYLPTLREGSYLFSFGSGGGYYDSCGGIATTKDFASSQPAKSIFTTLFGSYFGDWDNYFGNDIMRAVLCQPEYGLTCAWGERPHWYFHHMGMGEPIGFSQKLTQNYYDLYDTFTVPSSAVPDYTFRKGTHVALMGDPTLRLHVVGPPANFSATSKGQLTWTAPVNETILGFNVYRATSANGPFTKLNNTGYVTTTSFADTGVAPGTYTYMVKTIKLETGSGTYVNSSQGVFTTVTVSNDSAALARATYIGTDLSTQGEWRGQYGSEGYSIVGDGTSLPPYAQLAVSGTEYLWNTATSEVRALQRTAGGAQRVAACWYGSSLTSI